ncbi:MAG: histidine phosphatase family protein [Candidatus Falkowbacteria bacterium]
MKENRENFCTLYIVRHGETEWNAAKITQGQTDSPLTNNGISQVLTTAKELKNIKFNAIYSSDLGRTKQSAEILKMERELAIETSKALRERNYGSFESRPSTDFKDAFRDIRENIMQLSEEERVNFKFADDIESDAEIIARFITKLREISVANPAQKILVSTHGGPIRLLLIHTGYYKRGELPPGSIANAAYVKLLCDGIDFFIEEVKGIKK